MSAESVRICATRENNQPIRTDVLGWVGGGEPEGRHARLEAIEKIGQLLPPLSLEGDLLLLGGRQIASTARGPQKIEVSQP